MAPPLFSLPGKLGLPLILFTLGCATKPEPSPRIVTKIGGDLGHDAKPEEPKKGEETAPSTAPTPREFTTLPVEGFLPAPMAVPTVASPEQGHRLVVVAHGAGGRGEDHCAFWNERLPLDVWIVCPQGSLLNRRDPSGGAYFPDHRTLRNELRAVGEALLELGGPKLQRENWTFIGYSQGATMGALAIVSPKEADERERHFTRLLLIEGGGEYWTLDRAMSFKNAGGQSVTLACGTNGCGAHARRSVAVIEKAELDGTFIDAPQGGHTYGGKVAAALTTEIDKLF